ncbi:elongator complex protein 5 [Scaptodrosophila lebanonensis]|uniref:Elongator complex protein 5 n=1 Tax=Drosophila lebanonensis TaxID=7225 RepID=A0A6J2T6F5_DROLE|nr:elongator complex protein 5 [Scaptodrosophila lebanonensis]
MLSNLLITNQKFVLIIDETNRERIAQKFIGQLLHEQGQEVGSIKTLPIGMQLQHVASYEALLNEITNNNNNNNNSSVGAGGNNSSSEESSTLKNGYNIIMPTLADLLCYQTPAYIFEFLNKLRRAEHVRRIFLWASPQHLQYEHAAYILACCEYLAELVLHLETETTLSLISRKVGGGVSNRRYACQMTKTQFQVTPLAVTADSQISPQPAHMDEVKPIDSGGGSTFKIELDEDEVVARNALTMPYERTSEPAEGNIIYTPDAADDFDEEDPDEDLCI